MGKIWKSDCAGGSKIHPTWDSTECAQDNRCNLKYYKNRRVPGKFWPQNNHSYLSGRVWGCGWLVGAGFHSTACGTVPWLLLYARGGWQRTTPPGRSDAAQGSWGCRDFGHCRWLSQRGLGVRNQGSWGRSCPRSRCCGSGPLLPWLAEGQAGRHAVSIRHWSAPSHYKPLHLIITKHTPVVGPALKAQNRGKGWSVPSLAISLHWGGLPPPFPRHCNILSSGKGLSCPDLSLFSWLEWAAEACLTWKVIFPWDLAMTKMQYERLL